MDGYMAEIRFFAADFAPRGWMLCQGQLLTMADYGALYALLGPTYGGDGRTTFALPDFRGRIPIGTASGAGTRGNKSGSEYTSLGTSNMPVHSHGLSGHTHPLNGDNEVGEDSGPQNALNAAAEEDKNYAAPSSLVTMSSNAISASPSGEVTDVAGSSQPIYVVQPVLGLNYIICVSGLWPPRD